MRTILPIPQQAGFRVLLPGRVRLSPGTSATSTESGLRVARNGVTFSVRVPPQARDGLIRSLQESGDGLPTSGLATQWRQLFEKLAENAMLSDCSQEPANDQVPALEAIRQILDAIRSEVAECFPQGNALERLIAGEFDVPTAVRWLVENYHYTKSAGHHVSPVLSHPMSAPEADLWRRFLKDESWHWKIYRPAFGQFGLSFSEVDIQTPLPTTRHLIETLHRISRRSPVSYAATMIFIERSPIWESIDSDPLYQSLMTHYGFTAASVRPLWWHATENQHAGHSALGAVVISQRGSVGRNELDDALQAVRDTVQAVRGWQEGVLLPGREV